MPFAGGNRLEPCPRGGYHHWAFDHVIATRQWSKCTKCGQTKWKELKTPRTRPKLEVPYRRERLRICVMDGDMLHPVQDFYNRSTARTDRELRSHVQDAALNNKTVVIEVLPFTLNGARYRIWASSEALPRER